jgi:hypothetical protein
MQAGAASSKANQLQKLEVRARAVWEGARLNLTEYPMWVTRQPPQAAAPLSLSLSLTHTHTHAHPDPPGRTMREESSVGARLLTPAAGRCAEQKHVNAGFMQTAGLRMSDKVANTVEASERKGALTKMRTSDKSDRATVEQALDPRTRMVLFKMISRRVLR